MATTTTSLIHIFISHTQNPILQHNFVISATHSFILRSSREDKETILVFPYNYHANSYAGKF